MYLTILAAFILRMLSPWGHPEIREAQCWVRPDGYYCTVQLSKPATASIQFAIVTADGAVIPLPFRTGTGSIGIADKRRIESFRLNGKTIPAVYSNE